MRAFGMNTVDYRMVFWNRAGRRSLVQHNGMMRVTLSGIVYPSTCTPFTNLYPHESLRCDDPAGTYDVDLSCAANWNSRYSVRQISGKTFDYYDRNSTCSGSPYYSGSLWLAIGNVYGNLRIWCLCGSSWNGALNAPYISLFDSVLTCAQHSDGTVIPNSLTTQYSQSNGLQGYSGVATASLLCS